MQNHRRRIRLLRRFVLGLAVAAVVAPAAQARPDADDNVLRGSLPNGIVQGEYKSGLGDGVSGHPGGLIPQGERKAHLPQGNVPGGIVAGERKTDLPQGDVPGGIVAGERKTDLPQARYVPFVSDFPRTAPAPGEDASPAGYRRALPQDYGVVPVEVVRTPSTFDWGDALIGAGGAFALLLLAGGAALATHHTRRPAAAA